MAAQRPIPVADQTIAMSVLDQVYASWLKDETDEGLAAWILQHTAKVRFQPSTRQLVLTFDLAFNTSEPDTSAPVQ